MTHFEALKKSRNGLKSFHFAAAALLFFLYCGAPEPKKPAKSVSAPDIRCGHCAASKGKPVCTAQGQMPNSCYAVCRQAAILCKKSCPCPAE